jgi:tetratricopeptide (TPR) repeat protein
MPSERDQIGIAFDIFDDSPDATEIAKRWHTLSPDSAYSRLAYGKVLYAAAGSTRGSRTASETPEIDMRNARAAAAVAADMLQSALVVEPRLTPACTARVVAVRLSGGDEEPFAIGRQCVQRDPLSYFAALSWKGAAEPRWGGSDAQLSVVEAHILEHRDANPLLNSVLAALVADPLLNVEPNPQDATLAALERAARIAPHGQVLNQLSGSWFARGDKKRGFAYLSQAVRFNIGSLAHRNERMRMNVFMQPEWAKIDLAYLLRRYPTSVYYRQQLAQAEDNLRNGVAEKMARGETVTIDDGGASRKATFLSQCEEYGLSGKRSSDVMNECSDNLVMEWPEDPEAWRVRADVLHARGDPRALDAARKYLEIAPEDAPDREKRAARYRQWLKAAGG